MPKIRIETEGTYDSTKVFIDDKEVSSVKSLMLDVIPPIADLPGEVMFSFNKEELTEEGLIREVRFKLSKQNDSVAFDKSNNISDLDRNRFKSSAVIKKMGDEYCIFSKDGKKLECKPTRKAAQERLAQIEFFKHKKG